MDVSCAGGVLISRMAKLSIWSFALLKNVFKNHQ